MACQPWQLVDCNVGRLFYFRIPVIEYVNTKLNGADGLSRLSVLGSSDESLQALSKQTYLHFAQNALLLDHSIIKQQTLRDAMLSGILSYIRNMCEELCCVMWGHRVVIPDSCRSGYYESYINSIWALIFSKF